MNEDKTQLYKTDELKNIHTYSSDINDILHEKKGSVIDIALAEKERQQQKEMYREVKESKNSKWLFILGGIIILGAIGAFVYFEIQKANAPAPLEQVVTENKAMISYEGKIILDTTSSTNKKDVLNLLNAEVDNKESSGMIEFISLVKQDNKNQIPLTESDFFSLMKFSTPGPLTRSFSGQYMIGIYAEGNNDGVPGQKDLFFILGINNYDLAYASMLDWEKTLLSDMYDVFNIDLSNKVNLIGKPWEDVLINNKDSRVLYGDDGKSILYYVFVDKSNLVITNSKNAIGEISIRLSTGSAKPL